MRVVLEFASKMCTFCAAGLFSLAMATSVIGASGPNPPAGVCVDDNCGGVTTFPNGTFKCNGSCDLAPNTCTSCNCYMTTNADGSVTSGGDCQLPPPPPPKMP